MEAVFELKAGFDLPYAILRSRWAREDRASEAEPRRQCVPRQSLGTRSNVAERAASV